MGECGLQILFAKSKIMLFTRKCPANSKTTLGNMAMARARARTLFLFIEMIYMLCEN